MQHHSLFAEPRTWVAVAFVLFFVIFGRRLWAGLAGMLDARAAAIRAELAEAARLRQEAEQMLRNAQQEREAAARESEALIAASQAEAARLAASARAEAEAAAERRERMAMDRIAAAEKAAIDEVRLAAVAVATRAAEQVIAQGLSPEADSRIIDQAIARLPQALSRRAA